MKTLKYSRQRESIKACLMNRHDHPTADVLYLSIRNEFPNISLGTVYRNLNLLVDLGEIQKLSCGKGQIVLMQIPTHTIILYVRNVARFRTFPWTPLPISQNLPDSIAAAKSTATPLIFMESARTV